MGKPQKYDFSGWATKADIKCSDGRTILKHAFKDNDGTKVPLVWSHVHDKLDNVVGHAYLEDKEQGVRAYCVFNNTENGRNAKEMVQHGDITALSIFANGLTQNSKKEVIHGTILEVSLVLAGANKGAIIDDVVMHSESGDGAYSAIIIDYDEPLELAHSENSQEVDDNTENNNNDAENSNTAENGNVTPDEQKNETGENDLAHNENSPENQNNPDETNKEGDVIEHKAKEDEKSGKTVEEIINSMTEDQRNVLYLLVGAAHEEANMSKGENQTMKHNAFENIKKEDGTVLSHDEFNTIINEAKNKGSLKESFIAHGITDIDVLFPEEKAGAEPFTVSRDMEWVAKVMGSVSHSPFAKVKSMYFDITGDQARAKGYVKGHQKVEEVIQAFKRSVAPQTVYKMQKLDRDDIIDITDFDVLAYIKSEMRVMLNEELARAFLIGDGRSIEDEYKIQPEHIKPVWQDNEVYTVKRVLERPASISDEAFAKMLIKEVIKARKLYKGSGKPTFYTTEDMLTSMLLIEDKNERVIYDTIEKLKTALRVDDIVTVEPMEGMTRTEGANTFELLGLFVNMRDYKVGANKSGAVNFFDDFDINYNKLVYLIETRCSGALIRPYSAISFELKRASSQSNAAPASNN